MANTQIIIDATDTTNNQPVKKTITDINPKASNEQLATFGTMLNALTTNVYGGTTKITKVHCDGESDKPIPTLQLVDNSTGAVINTFGRERPTAGNSSDDSLCTLQYTGDGDLTISMTPVGCGVCFFLAPGDGVTHLGTVIMKTTMAGAQTGTFKFTIHASETENYQAASFDFTYTVS